MTPISSRNVAEKWRFARLGGFDQVELKRGSDLIGLPELDQKLWAALSCPTHGLFFDNQTLALLDTDNDGRIRANEVIEAVRWVSKVLKNPADLIQQNTTLPLAAINDQDEEGQQLLASAVEILKNLGKADATAITTDDLADMTKIFANTQFNGDGIIPVKAASDEAGQQAITDIIACLGEIEDRCGEPGINLEKIEQFFKEAGTYFDWWQQSDAEAVRIRNQIADTEAAAALLAQLKPKIDDFFTRCQLAEFDTGATELLNPADSRYEELAGIDLSASNEELAKLPLAAIVAGANLPLNAGLNPAWRSTLDQLKTLVLAPLLSAADSLSYAQWQSVIGQFADYQAWLQKKPANAVEGLGLDRIKTLLQSDAQAKLTGLIEQDLALEPQATAIDSVVRLLHYYRDLYTLLNNFVSFRDFYSAEPHAIFQAGTLYLDGRSCQLCVKVDDVDSHSKLAELSKIFLAYCVCRRQGTNETLTIAAAFTGGDSDNLRVGRNGVFYDRNGVDWDATIVKIIENPISVREAFWSPYKRVARMINEQLEKSAAARDKAANENTFKGISEAGAHAGQGKEPPAPFDVGKFAGIFAAIGLAIGAIGTALAAVLGSFMGLQWWQMPLAIIGVMLAISGPSMFIAYLKLRQRNLAPVLDACGWAVNAKAFINIPFGRLLTGVAKLPQDAEMQMVDPFGEKKSHWKSYVFLLILLAGAAYAWQKGYIGPKQEPEKAAQVEEKAAAAKAEAPAPAAAPAKPAEPAK